MSETVPRPTAEYIAQMFGAIADRYDLMNHVMTLWQDQRWRRQAVEVTGVRPGACALDVATGTADLAVELARAVQPGGSVVGVDIAAPMLALARKKAMARGLPIVFELADALKLPFENDRFDTVTCGFGLRNFGNRPGGLREMVRVVRPNRRVIILELTPPTSQLARRYMDNVVPRLGQLIAGAREAYTYLPESVHSFPDAVSLGQMMQESGLKDVTYRLFNFGTVALHWGTKPA